MAIYYSTEQTYYFFGTNDELRCGYYERNTELTYYFFGTNDSYV